MPGAAYRPKEGLALRGMYVHMYVHTYCVHTYVHMDRLTLSPSVEVTIPSTSDYWIREGQTLVLLFALTMMVNPCINRQTEKETLFNQLQQLGAMSKLKHNHKGREDP